MSFKLSIFTAAFAGLLLFGFCKNETPTPTSSNITLTKATLQKKSGADCDKPDGLQTDCATVNLSWPQVAEGPEALKQSVANWATQFLVASLNYSEESAPQGTTIQGAAEIFFKAHADFKKEAPDAPGSFFAESYDTVLLNDGKRLTLSILLDTYTGGAHGSHVAATHSFDAASGRLLTWSDMVTDTAALKVLAEKKFMAERPDLFKPESEGGAGFQFDDVFVFALPQNYGLTDKGIYFLYVPYEVTPYAFGPTGFVLSDEEISTVLKK